MKALPVVCVGILLFGGAVLSSRWEARAHHSGLAYAGERDDNLSRADLDAWNARNADDEGAAIDDADGNDWRNDHHFDRADWSEGSDDAEDMARDYTAPRDWNRDYGNRSYQQAQAEAREDRATDNELDAWSHMNRDMDSEAALREEWNLRGTTRYASWVEGRFDGDRPRHHVPAYTDPRADGYSWPAVDVDEDGVVDRLDRCPGTKAGEEVDACGCAFEATKDEHLVELASYPPGTKGNLQEAVLRRGRFSLDMAFFDTDKWQLRPEAEQALTQVASLIKEYPTLKFEIMGHADSRGERHYNHELSEARAHAVKNYLIWECGVRDLQLTARGYGERHLATAEQDGEQLQANRRVDFRVVNPEAIPRGSKPVRMGAMETMIAQGRGGYRPQQLAVRER